MGRHERTTAVIFFFLLFWGLQTPTFGSIPKDTRDTLHPWAKRLLSHYTILKKLNILKGPFFLAIDGPPGVGKSYLSQPLQELIQEEAHGMSINLNIQTFSQDSFLKSREARIKEFTPPVGSHGVSGYCAGEEYRWPELQSCLESVRHRRTHTASCYRRSDGKLHDNEEFDYTSADILIFEGCHSLGKALSSFMHFSFFITAPPELIRWNREQRGLKEGKTRNQIHALNEVSEEHYTKYILPNQHKAQVVFQWQPHNTTPQLQESEPGHPQTFERTLIEQRATKQNLNTRGLPEQKYPINNTLLSALSIAHPAFENISDERVLTALQELKQRQSENQLSEYQSQLLQPFLFALDSEIELLQRGNQGSLMTVIFLWATEMEKQQEPLQLVLTVQEKLTGLELNSLGEIKEIAGLLLGTHSIVGSRVNWLGISPIPPTRNTHGMDLISREMRRLSLPNIHAIRALPEKKNDSIPSFAGGVIFPGNSTTIK